MLADSGSALCESTLLDLRKASRPHRNYHQRLSPLQQCQRYQQVHGTMLWQRVVSLDCTIRGECCRVLHGSAIRAGDPVYPRRFLGRMTLVFLARAICARLYRGIVLLSFRFFSREDCQAQVDGFIGAKHRKLRTSNEAIEWLASNGVQLDEQESPPDPSQPPTTAPPTTADTQSASTSGARVVTPRLEAMSRIPRAGPSRIANRRVGRSITPPVQPNVGLPPGIESWVVYCDGACRGNGKTGSIAGVGVYWGEGDQRLVSHFGQYYTVGPNLVK